MSLPSELDEVNLLSLETQLLKVIGTLSTGSDLEAIQELRRYLRNRLKEIAWLRYQNEHKI